MAIDDNTTYGLTGAQVKELPEKINVVKGLAKELTANDYDYPTDNPTSIAAWLLPAGLYTAAESVQISRNTSTTLTTTSRKNFIILHGLGASYKIIVDLSSPSGQGLGITMYYVMLSGSAMLSMSFLSRSDVQNVLTSTSTVYPLSANQGKVLNDKIGGDLSNLTTTDKSSLINAINELVARVAALEGN